MSEVALVLLVAAASFVGLRLYLGPPEDHRTAEELHAVARDPDQSPDARGAAVFSLFARHVPANCAAATVRQVFGDCDWIAEANIYEFHVQSGQGHPLWIKTVGTLFRLDLFTPDGMSDWVIYVRFSDAHHSPEDVRRFFSPSADPKPGMRLVEFALWDRRTGKQEVFDMTGRHPPMGP